MVREAVKVSPFLLTHQNNERNSIPTKSTRAGSRLPCIPRTLAPRSVHDEPQGLYAPRSHPCLYKVKVEDKTAVRKAVIRSHPQPATPPRVVQHYRLSRPSDGCLLGILRLLPPGAWTPCHIHHHPLLPSPASIIGGIIRIAAAAVTALQALIRLYLGSVCQKALNAL